VSYGDCPHPPSPVNLRRHARRLSDACEGESRRSARIANDFVENALKPARTTYGNQCLPAGDSIRERQRCKAVKVRLSLLHAHLDALERDHAHAA
jgi:hypothetical protein